MCFLMYKISIEIYIYRLRPNTPINVDISTIKLRIWRHISLMRICRHKLYVTKHQCFMTDAIQPTIYVYLLHPNTHVNADESSRKIRIFKAQFINEQLQAQFVCRETPPLPLYWREGCFMNYEIQAVIYIYILCPTMPANLDN